MSATVRQIAPIGDDKSTNYSAARVEDLKSRSAGRECFGSINLNQKLFVIAANERVRTCAGLGVTVDSDRLAAGRQGEVVIVSRRHCGERLD